MFNRNWNNVAKMDVKLWRGSCLNISPKNAAEVFKSKRSRLIGKITLRDFEESHTKLASKVLKHIRDNEDLKCERLNFVNCNFVRVCPNLLSASLNRMVYVNIGDNAGITVISQEQFSSILFDTILNQECKIMSNNTVEIFFSLMPNTDSMAISIGSNCW